MGEITYQDAVFLLVRIPAELCGALHLFKLYADKAVHHSKICLQLLVHIFNYGSTAGWDNLQLRAPDLLGQWGHPDSMGKI